MNFNTVLTIKGNYITIVYTKEYETVAKMVSQHYDAKQFENSLFAVNVLTDEDSNNINFKESYPQCNKFIYYQLENLGLYPEYSSPDYIRQFDEIWDISQNNVEHYQEDFKDKVWYMPLRYVDIPKIKPKQNYRYDAVFIGTLTPHRQDELYRITKYWTDNFCRIKIINGYSYYELYDEISDCKYILDIPRTGESGTIVNAPRILEAICSGKQIIIEGRMSVENIFTWLVKIYGTIYTVHNIIKEIPADNSEIFKNWTDSDANYEVYRKYWMGDNYKQKLIY